jgi:hypothetical protein
LSIIKKTLRDKFDNDHDVLAYLNSISPSYCSSKWLNATIWLGSGMTTSCHHPPAHKINDIEIQTNPSAIHNTLEKINDRKQMLRGERPTGCDYCWKVEDNIPDGIPDRVHKSVIYNETDIKETLTNVEQVNLKTLEISFDRTCNFACSYCNPAFSSTWVKDIKKNGPYTDLVSDGRNHFTHTHDSAQLFKRDETNPYIDAFWKWWESDLKDNLDELRITGGEPFMSDEVWKILDKFAKEKPSMRLAINTNLIMKPAMFERFVEKAKDIEHLHIYTSGEGAGEHGEYIRDGFKWYEWLTNCDRVCDEIKPEGFHVMGTINALCLDSLPEFLSEVVDMKRRHGNHYATFTLNILRFPSFQSALVLPMDMLIKYSTNLQNWLDKQDRLSDMEINHVKRLIEYLVEVDRPHNDTFDMPKLHSDFKNFYKQYDARREKNFGSTFPAFKEWYDNL